MSQQDQNVQPYVPPHLHPGYRGRGRPPLSLGRRQAPGSSPGPSATPPVKKAPVNHPHARSNQLQPGQARMGYVSGPIPNTMQQQPGTAHLPAQHRIRKMIDGKEPSYLNSGPTNRLLLSLRSGLPSHITWALSRLLVASQHQPDSLLLESFPGLIETLLRFPKRLVAAFKSDKVEDWEPSFWEQEEREFDGFGLSMSRDAPDHSDEDSGAEDDVPTKCPSKFSPFSIRSHRKLFDDTLTATLILRNASTHEKNERIFLNYSKAINSLICDLLALPHRSTQFQAPEEWQILEGIEELKVYALDLLEVTRVRLQMSSRPLLRLLSNGTPIFPWTYFEPAETIPAEQKPNEQTVSKPMLSGVAEKLFALLVWLLHTSNDRSIVMGCLRCLGALAGEEKNEAAFVEMDSPAEDDLQEGGTLVTSPGILTKCLTFLPLTQDAALLEASLDCLYQVINIGDNALRLGLTNSNNIGAPLPLRVGISGETSLTIRDKPANQNTNDIRSNIRYLTRNLIYGRVVWDRAHQLTLHPALHIGVPSAVAVRRREKDVALRKRKGAEIDERERAKVRKLHKKEWVQIKDMKEPERLKAWMRAIYEPKEDGEVSQMEFWTTYSTQFGPYSQLGGPPLQPAAEVIRTVSSVFPGALAMVLPNQKFVVRGVEARDRSYLRRFECRWRGCGNPETDTFSAVEGHVHLHVDESENAVCQWGQCTFEVPETTSNHKEYLLSHVRTHLPETDEQINQRELDDIKDQVLSDYLWKRSLKSKPLNVAEMPNGARFIKGPTALDPDNQILSEWRRIEAERQEAKRRKVHNVPARGTVDWPDLVTFSVTRTPMDPQTSRPVGIASTSAFILRSLARTSAAILTKAGVRRRGTRQNTKNGTLNDESGTNERFGLPLPPTAKEGEGAAAQAEAEGSSGTGIVPLGDWAIDAAANTMDSLVDIESQVMKIASENDILCPVLNEILIELQPEPGESILETSEEEH